MDPLVLLHLQPRILRDGDVVAPCRGWEVDSFGVWEETREERGTDPEGAGTRDGLGDGELIGEVRGAKRI